MPLAKKLSEGVPSMSAWLGKLDFAANAIALSKELTFSDAKLVSEVPRMA
jgi:hypothetical protein